MEAFDWDWASFHENILLPNRMHIQLVMQLSDTITDRVVYLIHFCLMIGIAMMTKKMMTRTLLVLKNSFQWKTLTSNVDSNKSNIYREDLLIVMTNRMCFSSLT